MVTATATAAAAAVCALLAAAAAVLPLAPRARLDALWPRPRPARRWRPRAVAPALLGGIVGLLLLGPGGGLAGAGLAAIAGRRRIQRRVDTAVGESADQLAAALRRMIDELRAGSDPAAVLAGVGADGPRAGALLAPAAAAARLGDSVPRSLRRSAAERAGADTAADLDRIAAAWSLAERFGIPLADLLARAQQDIRWRIRFAATVRAQLAGPRATAAVLTALPALGLGLGQLLGADPFGVLRAGLLGQALLVVGVGMAAAGLAWSERILRAAVPR